jgi:hypothetical protein
LGNTYCVTHHILDVVCYVLLLLSSVHSLACTYSPYWIEKVSMLYIFLKPLLGWD